MGYKRKRKVYKLDFADTEYEGLIASVSGLTTGEYLDFISLSTPGDEADTGPQTQGMLEMLSRHLMSWNLLDEAGKAVPADFDGIKSNDLSMNLFIVDAWVNALSNVSSDAEKKSPSGDSPLAASIPMEILS